MFRQYCSAVWKHWVSLIGGIVSLGYSAIQYALQTAGSKLLDKGIPTPLMVVVGLGCFALAGYRAWCDEHEACKEAKSKADTGRPKLSIKFPYANLKAGVSSQMWLVNFGDRVATDITISPICRGPYEAVFPKIQNVNGRPDGINGVDLIPSVTKDSETHPIFSTNGQFLCDMVLDGLEGLSTDELSIPMTIKFSDGGLVRTNTLIIHFTRPFLAVSVSNQVY